MLEKEYLVCFVASSNRGVTHGDFFIKRDKINRTCLENLREKIKDECKEKLGDSKVIFTSLVCLGEVGEDE